MNARQKAFESLSEHPWYGAKVRALNSASRDLISYFITEHQELDFSQFSQKVDSTMTETSGLHGLLAEILHVTNGIVRRDSEVEHEARNLMQEKYLKEAAEIMGDRDRVLAQMKVDHAIEITQEAAQDLLKAAELALDYLGTLHDVKRIPSLDALLHALHKAKGGAY